LQIVGTSIMSNECYLCDGSGSWVDVEASQTVICPVCYPIEASNQSTSRVDLPRWYQSYWYSMPAKYYGLSFQVNPWLLIIHSGARAAGVAEYMVAPGDNRQVSTQFSWSITQNALVQQVPISNVAWHVKNKCTYRNQNRLNYCSIGIELPGPWDKKRTDEELGILRDTVIKLVELMPSLRYCVGHGDIDERKKDPGPYMKWSILNGLGLSGPNVKPIII